MSTPSNPACETPTIVQLVVVGDDRFAEDGSDRRRSASASSRSSAPPPFRRMPLAIVVRRDDAAKGGAHAEHLEVCAGHDFGGHALALPVDADHHRHRAAREQAGEDFRRRRRGSAASR